MNVYRQIFFFAVTGLFCLCYGMAQLYLFVDILGFHYILATVLNFLIGNIVGFVVNKNLTFNQSLTTFFPGLIRYYLGMGSNFFINIMFVAFLVEFLRLNYLLASFFSATLLMIPNFFIHKTWTFKLSHVKNKT